MYDRITTEIIAQLEAGVVPWKQPWASGPRNVVSRRGYRGVNHLLLAMRRHASPYWLTFLQARALGGTVRKGERGTRIVFFHPGADDDEGPVYRTFSVFNLEQCDGLAVPECPEEHPDCETLLAAVSDPPRMRVGRQPLYAPKLDEIEIPKRSDFASTATYYGTLFHELVHASGHPRRLARPAVVDTATFGSEPYSKEELVAELGAAFLCAHCGIAAPVLKQSSAYIAAWLRKLKGEPRLIVSAASEAQAAVDYLTAGCPPKRGSRRRARCGGEYLWTGYFRTI